MNLTWFIRDKRPIARADLGKFALCKGSSGWFAGTVRNTALPPKLSSEETLILAVQQELQNSFVLDIGMLPSPYKELSASYYCESYAFLNEPKTWKTFDQKTRPLGKEDLGRFVIAKSRSGWHCGFITHRDGEYVIQASPQRVIGVESADTYTMIEDIEDGTV